LPAARGFVVTRRRTGVAWHVVDLAPGDVVDRYRIEALLGEGGMGRVYRAYDTRLERRVALKILRTTSSDKDKPGQASEGAARLLREARAAAALDHPNAVSVFDVGEADGAPFIAMELIEGVSLRAHIGDAAVPWELCVRWLVDVARALEAAHKRGLVHRDIKPENVMIREDGVVKVLDFGIARRPQLPVDPSRPSDFITFTGKGLVVGTPLYMAPEQMRGNASVDRRADQFSWGVVAYELLSGRLPWDGGGDVLAAVADILTRDPPALDRPGIPSVVEATISKALAKAPANRFASMGEIVGALEPFVSPASAHLRAAAADSTTSTIPPPPSSASRRVPVEIPAAPRTAMAAALPTPPPPAATPTTTQARARARTRWVTVGGVALAIAVVAAALRGSLAWPPPTVGAVAADAGSGAATARGPRSSNPQALAAYGAAVQQYRDGATGAIREFEHAAQLDPTFAAAYLRIAVVQVVDSPSEARQAYAKATEFRASLDDRDQVFLEATEPWLRQPSDGAEYARRLRAALVRFPGDSEFLMELGATLMFVADYKPALVALDSALTSDPSFARLWWYKGQTQAYLGDLAGAAASLDRCLALAPSATNCLWNRAAIDEVEGSCAQEEIDARRWLGIDHTDPLAYDALAEALYAEGRPVEAIQEVLHQKWSELGDAERAQTTLDDETRLDLLTGDFASAEAHARELQAAIESDKNQSVHARPAGALVEAYSESGQTESAAAVADDFLKRRDAWLPDPIVEDFAIANDVTIPMLEAEARAGRLTAAQLAAEREVWTTRQLAVISEGHRGYLWVHGYAAHAASPTAATEALAARPRFEPLPPFAPKTIADGAMGHAYLLAGRVDDALPMLGRAARTCLAIELPIAHTRAQFELGAALEAKGDHAGACAAYAVVLARWGHANPKSVTAESAKSRARALACAP
jgi:serine/threonine protein kinase/tetratricopeptide (TPR) repeat protein